MVDGISNDDALKENANQPKPEPGKPAAGKKGPPPGLLPIETNKLLENSESGRIPRKAAIKSAERTKVLTSMETDSNDLDLECLEEGKGLGDAGAANVTVHRINEPIIDKCQWCYKVCTPQNL